MRKIHLVWIASWLAIGLSGCATTRPQGDGQACANWRWIGISRPGAQCPKIGGWTVRPLFPQLDPPESCDPSPQNPTPSLDVIRELNRFCVYEVKDPKKWLKGSSFPSAASADLVRLDQDCAALALGEKYMNAKEWTPDSTFLERAGKPATPIKIDNQRNVRLAFLDTEPTGERPERLGHSPHGYTLANIARKLTCTSESPERCAAQITTRLALPIIEFDPVDPKHSWIDLERGGYFGMQSDLAEAIRNEVDNWRSSKSQRHLILNLSLAWDGKLFGGLSQEQISQMHAGTQAVYQALRYAADFDVLVLAAAGNRKREPCSNFGPLLPAAWEREPPRDESCQKPRPTRLLYAVGGLQSNGHPLPNSRPGGMPERAAFGETDLFVGSSVATAVVSSIAAVVWNYFPDYNSHEIMYILDQSGVEQSIAASFWFGAGAPPTSSPPRVRRLSLCRALRQACVGITSDPCPIITDDCDQLGDGASEGTTSVLLEPDRFFGSCQPWLFPQPEDDPCPACIRPKPPGI